MTVSTNTFFVILNKALRYTQGKLRILRSFGLLVNQKVCANACGITQGEYRCPFEMTHKRIVTFGGTH